MLQVRGRNSLTSRVRAETEGPGLPAQTAQHRGRAWLTTLPSLTDSSQVCAFAPSSSGPQQCPSNTLFAFLRGHCISSCGLSPVEALAPSVFSKWIKPTGTGWSTGPEALTVHHGGAHGSESLLQADPTCGTRGLGFLPGHPAYPGPLSVYGEEDVTGGVSQQQAV